jgi:SAM-dependent methyltransferase
VGDARRLPVVAGRFDAVTMFAVIEHLPAGTEPEALAEVARALRPGGLLFVSTPADWLPGTLLDPARRLIGHRHYARVRLLDMVGSAGLEPVLADTRAYGELSRTAYSDPSVL